MSEIDKHAAEARELLCDLCASGRRFDSASETHGSPGGMLEGCNALGSWRPVADALRERDAQIGQLRRLVSKYEAPLLRSGWAHDVDGRGRFTSPAAIEAALRQNEELQAENERLIGELEAAGLGTDLDMGDSEEGGESIRA